MFEFNGIKIHIVLVRTGMNKRRYGWAFVGKDGVLYRSAKTVGTLGEINRVIEYGMRKAAEA